MKKLIITLVVGLLIQQITQAQGTIYWSDLSQSSTGSQLVGSDSWLAADFLTGNNTSGYSLDSVQLAMTDASGSPSGFTVMIYDANGGMGGTTPGSSLGILNGSANPSTAAIYDYVPNSSLMLLPSTDYFIVLTAGTMVANGAYEWSVTDTPSIGLDGWGGNNSLCHSGNGSSWSFLSGTLAQYAVTAAAIPEPGVLSVLGLCVLFFLCHRRNAKAV